ncbi:hypothetical protein AA0114_g2642 [Alternaria tenuissima]|uniref:ADF-H domain-containing protein n=1 Tax=Alternaria tenuissima TaxID=119927 RepID=A0A4Q4MQQ9_9PLEO|nr:hypothetical protein AA0114_g2642 [Alternaria tenuissima]
MQNTSAELAFRAFIEDKFCFALPLDLVDNRIEAHAPIRQYHESFQLELNELESNLDTSKPAYIVLRRGDSLTFITYVPYRAKEELRNLFLERRHSVVQQLGARYISSSIICKEIAEITDARSWVERDAEALSLSTKRIQCDKKESCGCSEHSKSDLEDVEYRKNKCRLCDRRMKNKISSEALEALRELQTPFTAVQIVWYPFSIRTFIMSANLFQFVDVATEILELSYIRNGIIPEHVAATLPNDRPSFTFYRHPDTQLLYFIFHSPDDATVQERMKHIMAIPGLINVHSHDRNVHVDQKIEIHDPDDLVFEAKDERIGRFRSVYLRNKFEGTESTYDNLEADKTFYDKVR